MLRSAGWNVNTPVVLSYDRAPPPVADPVPTVNMLNVMPVAVEAMSGLASTQALLNQTYKRPVTGSNHNCPSCGLGGAVSVKNVIDPPLSGIPPSVCPSLIRMVLSSCE